MTVGYIYEAQDKILKKNVALKIEKKDKNKSILIFEYNVLNLLKGKDSNKKEPRNLRQSFKEGLFCNTHPCSCEQICWIGS